MYSYNLCFFSLYNCSSSIQQKQPPPIENGVLDLRDWNFKQDGPVDCKGEWKFKWKEDSEEYKLPEYDDSGWESYYMPASWVKTGRKDTGFCWYRLRIKLEPTKGLAIYLFEVSTAFKMYVNGQELMSNGKAGNSMETTEPQQMPLIAELPKADELIIAMKVSNFHVANVGGYIDNLEIGDENNLRKAKWKSDFLNFVILGIMIMMVLYHFMLWLGRREDRASLIFSFFSLLICLRLLRSNLFFQRLLQESNIFFIRLRIEYITIPLGWTVFITFLSQLFPNEFKNKILTVFQIADLLISGFILIAPVFVFTSCLLFINTTLIIVSLWMIYSIIVAVKNKRGEAGIVHFCSK